MAQRHGTGAQSATPFKPGSRMHRQSIDCTVLQQIKCRRTEGMQEGITGIYVYECAKGGGGASKASVSPFPRSASSTPAPETQGGQTWGSGT